MNLAVVDSTEFQRLVRVGRILVCCDNDGTLAPIVADPTQAFPEPGATAALERLVGCPGVSVAVVSGRAVRVLRELSGVGEGVALVGSHGAEFAEGVFPGLGDPQRQLLAELRATARAITEGVPGAAVEEKPTSVAIHTRRASQADSKRVMAAATEQLVNRAGVFVTEGKEVVEVAVLHADKGDALRELQASNRAEVALFVGDDVTDERAFAKLADADVGVKVGTGKSLAPFRIDSPAETVALLNELAELRGC